jgi:hypothetical protein
MVRTYFYIRLHTFKYWVAAPTSTYSPFETTHFDNCASQVASNATCLPEGLATNPSPNKRSLRAQATMYNKHTISQHRVLTAERDGFVVLYCTVLSCIALHCIVMYCTVMYCTVLGDSE